MRIKYLRYVSTNLAKVEYFGCHPYMSYLHKAYRHRSLARRSRNRR